MYKKIIGQMKLKWNLILVVAIEYIVKLHLKIQLGINIKWKIWKRIINKKIINNYIFLCKVINILYLIFN